MISYFDHGLELDGFNNSILLKSKGYCELACIQMFYDHVDEYNNHIWDSKYKMAESSTTVVEKLNHAAVYVLVRKHKKPKRMGALDEVFCLDWTDSNSSESIVEQALSKVQVCINMQSKKPESYDNLDLVLLFKEYEDIELSGWKVNPCPSLVFYQSKILKPHFNDFVMLADW